jgi:DinB superfamily
MPGMNSTKTAAARPAPTEYAPFYETYVSRVSGTDIVAILEAQRLQMTQLLAARGERDGNFRYAPNKWSVKEVVGHINDTERIFAYRAVRIARGDQTPLSGFEQDDYVRAGGFGERTLVDLAEEFTYVRSATVALFRPLSEEAWGRRGMANKNEVTVRALAFIIAGHELHHREILKERYFPAIPRA